MRAEFVHLSERKLIKRFWCGCYRVRIQTAHTESRAAAHTHQHATRSTIVWPGLAHTSSLKNNKIILKNPKNSLLIKLNSTLQAGKAQHETTGKIFFLFPGSACQMSRQGYFSTGHCCLFHTEDLVCHSSFVSRLCPVVRAHAHGECLGAAGEM